MKNLENLEKEILHTYFICHEDGYKGTRFVIYDKEGEKYSSCTWRKSPGPHYFKYENQGNGTDKKEFGFGVENLGELAEAHQNEDENKRLVVVFVKNFSWRDHLNSDHYWGIPYKEYEIKAGEFKKIIR